MDVYTDGSFNTKLTSKASGWAVIFVLDDTPESYMVDIHYGAIDEPDYAKIWNVGGELYAAIAAIDAAELIYKASSLRIFHDYLGLVNWADGKWKANNVVTKGYKEFIRRHRNGMSIQFKWVRGHQGNLLNEVADHYAGLGISNYVNHGTKQTNVQGLIIPKNQKFKG